ncbi:hypothetical protein M9H77_30562 [Catharanthus roseus]|uniref:Uncharacterized protein n=1 Tax=Catharanthus roseus TaxID=4058 RepID=A0ACB9ZZF4_CATRO|nr:hypothetical protein M9H77_30562 [Catharanthus roseus]
MLDSITLDLDPVNRGRSTVGGLGPRRHCVLLRIMLCCSGYFLESVVVAPMCLDSLRLFGYARTLQEKFICCINRFVPYSAAIDLARETVGRSTTKVTLMRKTLEIQTYLLFRKFSGPHSPDHETEVMPESSSHGQTNTASHEIMGNFMTKMTELLEATLANRRGERAQSTSNDEALERFLPFRPSDFHGEVEQEAKAELFLEQLNNIYDTLQYEGARRVTFITFRLRGTAKDWWLRISEAQVLINQLWT